MSLPTVSILGLGAMGSRMATRLLDAGFPVVVWNRSPAPAERLESAGARRADTPAAAAAGADVVLSMLRDDAASRLVWSDPDTGALSRLGDEAVAIECSTVTPDRIDEWAREAGPRAGQLLDAPVVGTRPHAERGILTFLVGGDADRLETVRPVFDTLGGAAHHAGALGSGAALKLAVNALFASQVGAIAELLVALESTPVEGARAVEILNALPTASPAAIRATELIASGHTSPNFPVELVAKDLDYASRLLERAGVDSDVVAGTRAAFARGVERGLGETDIVGIVGLHRP